MADGSAIGERRGIASRVYIYPYYTLGKPDISRDARAGERERNREFIRSFRSLAKAIIPEPASFLPPLCVYALIRKLSRFELKVD